jgi:hypothetical protein
MFVTTLDTSGMLNEKLIMLVWNSGEKSDTKGNIL